MRISETVESAVHVCIILAAVGDGSLPAGRLAEFHSLPAASMAKQLQLLSAAGIVESSAGRSGGYRLARGPADVSLLDVVLAVDGTAYAFRCKEIRRQGPCAVPGATFSTRCNVTRHLHEAEDAWRASLASVSLADLGVEVLHEAPPEVLEASVDWLDVHITATTASGAR